ncbi:MAG: CmpA/NrtA family ABC transporter substrate-binding protein [Acetobacteraceae bacterium]
MNTPIRIGVLRLVDSAPVMVAHHHGLFAACGLDASISIEPSWANVADKLAYGLLDAAVMLPPLALAAAIGLRGPSSPLIVPMGLTQGGNSIVLGGQAGAAVTDGRPGGHLLAWLRGQPAPPRFAVVHRFSTHNLLLRYWLAQAGVDPDSDIETIVVPPEQVVDAMATQRLAGFCAGAPWGDAAQMQGKGRVLIGTSSIWPFHPEKCLAVRQDWADTNPAALRALIRALLRAQVLCDEPAEGDAVADLLADPCGLGLPREACRAALPGGDGAETIRFQSGEVWFPAHAHALWFLRQMRRWGWIDEDHDLAATARAVYRSEALTEVVLEEGLYASGCVRRLEGNAMLPLPDDDAFAPQEVRQ